MDEFSESQSDCSVNETNTGIAGWNVGVAGWSNGGNRGQTAKKRKVNVVLRHRGVPRGNGFSHVRAHIFMVAIVEYALPAFSVLIPNGKHQPLDRGRDGGFSLVSISIQFFACRFRRFAAA